MEDSILTLNQVKDLRKKLAGRKIVLAGGAFDILHLGHITFLENAKKEGQVLVVLLESDERVKAIKGEERPINNQEERAKVLSSLRFVDFVVKLPFFRSDNEYDEITKKISPAIIATTQGDEHIHHKQRQAKLIGAELKVVTPRIPHRSTSKLVKELFP